jgi:uncharacterized SAM-binding protein YcdF (DUF218 family)
VTNRFLFWHRRLRIVERRTVWCPTLLGSFLLLLTLVIPGAWWFLCGESFLTMNGRLPAEVLVVEGWIGYRGIRAAAAEFQKNGYQYVVTTGGLTEDRWSDSRSNYADMAERELVRSGVPAEKIIVAPAGDPVKERTYACAVAVCQALRARDLWPNAFNVFTLGSHARRSRLVFAKANHFGTKVGVIGWVQPRDKSLKWWQSSERAKEFVAETVAYGYELLLNSGRTSNSADSARPLHPIGAAPNATLIPLHLAGLRRGLASTFIS